MKLRDLQYLVALNDTKHFGKAAKLCHVSQPCLSMQIKKLEAYLGIQLIERLNKSPLITDAGKKVVRSARGILESVKTIENIAHETQNPDAGQLKLGSFPTLAPYVFPTLCKKTVQKLPALQLLLVEEKTDTLIKQLLNAQIDAAILSLPIDHPDLTYETLFTEPFLLAVPKAHPLANMPKAPLSLLTEETFLFLNEGHCLRDQALSICHITPSQEQETFYATSLETLRTMVSNGIGMTLMPHSAIKPHDNIVYIPFDSPPPSRTIGMVYRKTSARLMPIKKISNILHAFKS